MSNVLPYLMSYRGRLANKDTSAADARAEESAQEDPGAPGEPQAHAPEHSLMVMLVDTAIMKASRETDRGRGRGAACRDVTVLMVCRRCWE